MGRREIATGGSPVSAESSFRELDDVFLQTQTRIWLGEVLKMRLDEELHISDFLADGDLLYEVSRVVWDMLLAKCPELRQLKHKPLDTQKSSGRYRPYSNVDSFLKVCKILGLNGIDLFSPTDAIEKRNIRKVCICIRALSKKARSKHLKVPDFDVVTYTVAMPKDLVGGIRRSLETSQSSFSSSSSFSSNKDHKQKVMQTNLTEAGDQNYDSCSEESDEAESKYMGEESYCSSTNNVEYIATPNSDCESSPGVCSAVRKSSTKQDRFSQFGSESTKFPSSRHTRNNFSSPCVKSQRKLHKRASRQNDNVHFGHVDHSLENYASEWDSMYGNEAEGNYIADFLAYTDSIISGTDGSSPILLEEEDNTFNFFMGLVDRRENKSSDDIEDLEVSSTTSMSSVFGRALNLEFDDHFDIDDHNALLDSEVCSQNHSSITTPKAQDVSYNRCVSYDVNSDNRSSLLMKSEQLDTSSASQSYVIASNSYEALEEKHQRLPVKDSDEFPNEAENVGASKGKAQKRPILHTIARGTAIFGVIFLLIHLGRRNQDKSSDRNRKPPQQHRKFKGRDIGYNDGQNGGRGRIYPAGKLKFKN